MATLFAKALAICVEVNYNNKMLQQQLLYMKGIFMRINEDTKAFKVLNALQSGERLTESAARKRFGVGNLSAEVSRIRQAGYAVYANKRTAGNHVEVTEYRLGTPSRRLIAAGYKALAMGIA